jgi:hypothetical protein
MLRKNWNLYLKYVPAAAVIYVVNISEDIERIRESKQELHMLMCEPML